HRDIAAFSDELARQLAAHARAAPGDHGDLAGEILHRMLFLPFCGTAHAAPALLVLLSERATSLGRLAGKTRADDADRHCSAPQENFTQGLNPGRSTPTYSVGDRKSTRL